ncbi:hypothetical protein NX774_20865 [Massilia agilis]|uniref:Uncharacterized protein n=1 Tax=Massilia agilis TaxID=1811226 RepID=A0ABT2DGW1_9BURK|nr:hypothetical protein [Massilia agilis]MCS0810383.1 hypothetical protein [Massilia agilis]
MPVAISIDNYLHSHNGDKAIELCGKLAIVRAILLAESSSKLRYDGSLAKKIDLGRVENTWLAALMRFIGENCSRETIKKRLTQLAFVVFNYDRCIEHFFFHAFRTYFRMRDDEAAELVKSLEIYHPYGTVGGLPLARHDDAESVIEFGRDPDETKLLALAKGIKTFTEGMDPASPTSIAMHKCVASASRTVFLGFAFHPLNMELMCGASRTGLLPSGQAYGTVYKTSHSDVKNIETYLRNTMGFDEVFLEHSTSVELFHEYSRTLRFD